MNKELNELYNLGREVPKELINLNKDTWLVSNNIIEARYLDINDAINNPNLSISTYLSQQTAVLMYPNRVGNVIIDIFVRPLYTRVAPLKLGPQILPYNIGNFRQDFKYGDPIILVEGTADLALVKLLGELDIIAMNTAKLPKHHLETLTKISNNFLLLADNDEPGQRAARSMTYDFRERGATLKILPQFKDYKDTGDLLQDLKLFTETQDYSLKNKIEQAKTYYRTLIKNNK